MRVSHLQLHNLRLMSEVLAVSLPASFWGCLCQRWRSMLADLQRPMVCSCRRSLSTASDHLRGLAARARQAVKGGLRGSCPSWDSRRGGTSSNCRQLHLFCAPDEARGDSSKRCLGTDNMDCRNEHDSHLERLLDLLHVRHEAEGDALCLLVDLGGHCKVVHVVHGDLQHARLLRQLRVLLPHLHVWHALPVKRALDWWCRII